MQFQDSIHKNENESQCVRELYSNCEKGDYCNIKRLLEEKDFSSKTLDTAVRKCIRNHKQDRKEYLETLYLLLQYIDINYINQSEDYSTILLLACETGDCNIVELIVKFDYSTNINFPKKIDLNVRDEMNRNIVHYLINNGIDEDEALSILNFFIDLKDNSLNINELVSEEDKNGLTPMSMCFILGWFNISKKIMHMRVEKVQINRLNMNNMIHCAILGNNLNCLRLILKESKISDFKHKNKDDLTPYELAKKKGLTYFAQIIKNFEENCCNQNYIDLFDNQISVDDILDKFQNEEYHEVLILLNQLKVNESIKYVNFKYDDLSIEWNIFITKFYMKKDSNKKQSNNISPESILSKFLDSSPNLCSNVVSEFTIFFNSINQKYNNEYNVIDILYYNKQVFFLKTGDNFKLIRNALSYINDILPENDGMFYKWMIYVNITLTLIEVFLNLRYTKIVENMITKLEEYLFVNYQCKNDDSYHISHSQIAEYLNKIEMLNKYSLNWDESFCALELYKSMKYLYEGNLEKCRYTMKNYKRLYKLSNYGDELKIFITLHNFYECLKIQLYYYENSYSKCNKKLNKILKITEIKEVVLTINKTVYKNGYNINEYILFYYNSLGIINLKQKKYYNSEYFFKICINYYKKFYNLQDLSIKINFIFSIKYNLALCYFYQKKYDKAYLIFKQLSRNKNFSNNIFLYYRLGLCCLELFLINLKKFKSHTCSDIISNYYGYEHFVESDQEDDIIPDIPDDDESSYIKKDKIIKSKRIILQNRIDGIDNKILLEAIYNFKEVLIYEKLSENGSIYCPNYEIEEIYKFYSKKLKPNNNVIKQNYKSLNLIITSTYLSLLYSLSLNGNWNEILYYHLEFEKSEFYKNEKEIILKFDNFKIEALINLKENNKAIELLKNNIILHSNTDFRANFFSKLNNVIYSDISFRISLYINLIKLHLINDNLSEAEKCLTNLIPFCSQNQSDIPSCVHNIFIYFHLVKGNIKDVLQLIKYRKISTIINCIKK